MIGLLTSGDKFIILPIICEKLQIINWIFFDNNYIDKADRTLRVNCFTDNIS